MSLVRVVVIDWTDTGWSLPTPTLPTWIWRVWRRGASTGAGADGMPRLTVLMPPSVLAAPRPDPARPAGGGRGRLGQPVSEIGATTSPMISTTPITISTNPKPYATGSIRATST